MPLAPPDAYPEGVLGTLARLRADDAGQALAEYAIVLAIMGGLGHLGAYANNVLADPRRTVLAGIVVGVVVFFLSARRR